MIVNINCRSGGPQFSRVDLGRHRTQARTSHLFGGGKRIFSCGGGKERIWDSCLQCWAYRKVLAAKMVLDYFGGN